MKKTKIICTIGPKSESISTLSKLLIAGMDVMRLNCSHGSHSEHRQRIRNLLHASKQTNKQFAILLDTKGPEIRTMGLEKHTNVVLRAGQSFSLKTNSFRLGNNRCVAITCSDILDQISVGNTVFIDDGLLKLAVKEIQTKNIVCKVLNDGVLGENKSVNFPEISVSFPILSQEDKQDLIFGCQQNVDFVAVSFVRTKEDVIQVRKFLHQHDGKHIQVISKIENQEGLSNFDSILQVSDGIMVARGDLGVEIPMEKVIFAQKMIIEKCNSSKKIAITATHMLESMVRNPRPTRAEAGDVSNAILDGTDSVMLSGESAQGKYPVESVQIMSRVCGYTDSVLTDDVHVRNSSFSKNPIDAICQSIAALSDNLRASVIIAATRQGRLIRSLRRHSPASTILALTHRRTTARQLILLRGVHCRVVEKNKLLRAFHHTAKCVALREKFAHTGDTVVMMPGFVKFYDAVHVFSVHWL